MEEESYPSSSCWIDCARWMRIEIVACGQDVSSSYRCSVQCSISTREQRRLNNLVGIEDRNVD
jgi:hypothetical protein